MAIKPNDRDLIEDTPEYREGRSDYQIDSKADEAVRRRELAKIASKNNDWRHPRWQA